MFSSLLAVDDGGQVARVRFRNGITTLSHRAAGEGLLTSSCGGLLPPPREAPHIALHIDHDLELNGSRERGSNEREDLTVFFAERHDHSAAHDPVYRP